MAVSSSSSEDEEGEGDDDDDDTDNASPAVSPAKAHGKRKRVEGADVEVSSEDDGLPRSADVEQTMGGRGNRTEMRCNFQNWVDPPPPPTSPPQSKFYLILCLFSATAKAGS